MSGLQSSSSRRRETASSFPAARGVRLCLGLHLYLEPQPLRASPRQEGRAGKTVQAERNKFTWEACSGFLRRWVESCKSDLLAGQTELLKAGRSRGFWPAASSLPSPASSSWRESSGWFQQPDLGPCSTPTIPTWHTVSGLRTQKLSSRRAHFWSPGPRVMSQARASPGLEGGC